MLSPITKIALCVAVALAIQTAQAETRYVDSQAAGANDGTSWTDAFNGLADALDKAGAGDQIWVAAGTYRGPFVLKDGVALIGGFKGGESSVGQSDPTANPTYLTGANASRVLSGLDLGPQTTIRGFHFVEGYTDVPEVGAGLLLENSRAAVVECTFANNRTKLLGGAVAVLGGAPTFVNCRFTQNDGGSGGGAVLAHHEATPTFVNCLFDHNVAGEAGAVALIAASATLINCTLADNRATIRNGGALYDTRGQSSIRNSIFWNNQSAQVGAGDIFNHPEAGGRSSVSFTTVPGGWAGEGNSSGDPKFVAPAAGDYRLSADSPCRDAGNNDVLPVDTADLSADGDTNEPLPFDLRRADRVSGSAVDRGAFEYPD